MKRERGIKNDRRRYFNACRYFAWFTDYSRCYFCAFFKLLRVNHEKHHFLHCSKHYDRLPSIELCPVVNRPVIQPKREYTTMNKITINEQDKKVADFLKSIGVNYSVNYSGFKKDKGWERDSFVITFNDEEFDYNTGIGHRVEVKRGNKVVGVNSLYELNGFASLFEVGRTTKNNQYYTIYIVYPTAASVLYCLLIDSMAIDTSFDYWCDEFGYSNDSIEALNIYQACYESAKKLKNVFKNSQIEEMRELLQDY